MSADTPAGARDAAEVGASRGRAESGRAADGVVPTDGVVVHLPEADARRQETVLRNTTNLVRALEPGAPVELVAHGPGVELCTGESGLAEAVVGLQRDAVTVCACANTLSARGLTQADLLPGVAVVDSGVAHLVRRQRAGWAYLRP